MYLNCENQYDFIDDISIIYSQDIVFLNGKDVSKDIRSEEVTNNVSTTAKLKRVRDKMVYFQRESAKNGKIIMDGRDIGTVVLPNANLKIFLTASAEARAKRRCLENESSGIESNFETILKEIKERDYKDSHREISPLKMADDAILIDTTENIPIASLGEVKGQIVNIEYRTYVSSDKLVHNYNKDNYIKDQHRLEMIILFLMIKYLNQV